MGGHDPAPAERRSQLDHERSWTRKSRITSQNTMPSRPNTMLMSSMIDSLGALEAPVSGDMRRYTRTVEGGQHVAASGAWYTKDGRVPPPTTRSSSRFFLQNSTPSPQAAEPMESASRPIVSPQQSSHRSHASIGQDPHRSKSTTSRNSADGSQTTRRSRKSKRRTTHQISAFGPSQPLEGEAENEQERREEHVAIAEPVVRVSPRKIMSDGTNGALQTPTRTTRQRTVTPSMRIVTDVDQEPNGSTTPHSDRAHELNGNAIAQIDGGQDSPKWKGKAVATEEESSTPLDHQMTPNDMIPTRKSSLHYTSRAIGSRIMRGSNSSDPATDGAADPREDILEGLAEEVYTELGEEHETVKKIRRLQEQRAERIRTEDPSLKRIREFSERKKKELMRAKYGEGEAEPVAVSPALETPTSFRQGSIGGESTASRRFAPLQTSPGSRVPSNSKANKILGLTDASTPTSPQSPTPYASRLERPFDPATEIATLNRSRSPTPDSEQGDTSAYHDYARYLQASGTQHRTNDMLSESSPIVPAKDNSHNPSSPGVASPSDIQQTPSSQSAVPPKTIKPTTSSRSLRRPLSGRHESAEPNGKRYRQSTDEDVDTYINSPRLNRIVRVQHTGRIISYSDVGDPSGFPVLVCVGMGLNRFMSAFYDDLARELGLRLITPDRPGVGKSEPLPSRESSGPLAWHEDVLAIAQSLGLDGFGLLAHSAGAVYALALSLALPNLITGPLYLLAPWIPPSQAEPFQQAPPLSHRLLRILPTPLLKAANAPRLSFSGRPSSTSSSSSPKPPAEPDLDQVASDIVPPPAPPEVRSAQRTQRLFAASTAAANPARDIIVCLERNRPVGFQYSNVTAPVVVYAGKEDRRVRVEAVRRLVGRMDRARVHRGDSPVVLKVLDGEGHGLMSSPKAMGEVLGEISEGWRGWLE